MTKYKRKAGVPREVSEYLSAANGKIKTRTGGRNGGRPRACSCDRDDCEICTRYHERKAKRQQSIESAKELQ